MDSFILVLRSTVLLYWCLSLYELHVGAKECADSSSTARSVFSCPKTAKEWREAAKKKNCSSIKHTCSSFEYHCVVNAWMNDTLEVCVPKRIIVGKKCVEFNYGGNRIQNHHETCKNCPDVYYSDQSFNYKECYENVYKWRRKGSSLLSTISSVPIKKPPLFSASTTESLGTPVHAVYAKNDRPVSSSFQNVEHNQTLTFILISTAAVYVLMFLVVSVYLE